MQDITVRIGARLAATFKSTFEEASGAVAGMAAEIARGSNASSIALGWLGDVVRAKLLGPFANLVIGIGGVNAALWVMAKTTEAAATGLKAFSTVEDLEAQFRPLLGSLSAAKGRLAELADFAAKTPFELPEVAAASKTLEVLTKGALATGDGLRIVGELAAQSGRPFQELAMWVGRLYDGLQSGRPVGEAMMRLQELGFVSGEVRTKIEALQKAGKAGNEVWKIMTDEFSKVDGSMERMSKTITGLRSTLEDAKKELSRAVGANFAEQERESLDAAKDATEAFIPVASHLAERLASIGAGDVPSNWFAVFDVQLKKFATWVLKASEVWKVFIDGLIVVGAAAAVGTIISIGRAFIGTTAQIYLGIRAIHASAAAHRAHGPVWQAGLVHIRANTVAMMQYLSAMGRSGAMMKVQAAGMVALRYAAGYLVGTLNALKAAFLNPVTALALLGTAVWNWVQSQQAALERMQEFNNAFAETAAETAKAADEIETLSDKVAFLAAQYAALAEARKRFSLAGNPEEKTKAADDIKHREDWIRAIEGGGGGRYESANLKPGEELQRLKEEYQKIEKEQAEAKFNASQKVASAEKELLDLQAQRAGVAKTVAEAEQAASGETVAGINAQIEAQKRLIAENERFLEVEAQKSEAKAAATRARLSGFGVMAPIASAPITEESSKAREAILAARSAVAALEKSKEGRSGALQGALNAEQTQANQILAAEAKLSSAKEEARLADYKTRILAAEFYYESQIAGLRLSGSQQAVEEINVRQRLLALKVREAEIEGQASDAAAARLEYSKNEQRLLDMDKDRNQRVADSKKERLEAREERVLSQLPKKEQAAALKKKENDLNADAGRLERQAAEARRGGNDARADDLEGKAEERRKKADQYGSRAGDLLKQSSGVPVVSSMARIGGAAGEGSASTSDVAKRQLKTLEDLKRELVKVSSELESLRRESRKSPEWDEPFDQY